MSSSWVSQIFRSEVTQVHWRGESLGLLVVEVGPAQAAGQDRVVGWVVGWLQEHGVDLQRVGASRLGGVVAEDVGVELGGSEGGLHLVGTGVEGIEQPAAEGEQ